MTGYTVNGGYAEYVLADPADVGRLSGIGGLGHMAAQYSRAMGFHVIAVDMVDEKLAVAERLGADMTVNAATQDAVPGPSLSRT
jgi:alcohol dehydrogenase, propanol-preferring